MIQLSYFFGDNALVKNTEGVTYSSYARSGFFEIVVLATLTIIALWIVDWMVRDANDKGKRFIRLASLVTILLLFAIEASAIHRMMLYTNAYGLTELRFYSSAFMAWIAVMCIIFTLTILRKKRGYFLSNSVIAGILIVIGLNIVNPDALMANHNINRSTNLSRDIHYLASLSSDATPTIVENIDKFSNKQKILLNNFLTNSSRKSAKDDWRTFNPSSYQARRALTILKAKTDALLPKAEVSNGWRIAPK